MTSIHSGGPGLSDTNTVPTLQRPVSSPGGQAFGRVGASLPRAAGAGNAAGQPARGEAMDKDEVRYIVVCLLAVPLIFWLLGPFMGLAALIVFAALFFVWREPDAPNRIRLRWDGHCEPQSRAE